MARLIKDKYEAWKQECNERFMQLKANEEELNRIFIDIYGLQDELTPDVADKDVTVHFIVDSKEEIPESMKGSNYILTKRDNIVSLISYAVGCMLGRYSLDVEGLAYAGGDWDSVFRRDVLADESGDRILFGNNSIAVKNRYTQINRDGEWIDVSFEPDADNCLPITDEEYFQDDIVGRFVEFIKVVYGAETLEENLQFVADALGGKGSTSRAVIRNYFLNDFYKDHCQTYSVTGSGKRPIYWLFDSGKQNGFKALVYMHRWNADTIGNITAEYLIRMQKTYEHEMVTCQEIIENSTNNRDIAVANKRKDKLQKQYKETQDYYVKMSHLANERIDIDLDDGVKVNYRKVQTSREGEFLEILADSKDIMVKEK